ncbi:hypothetical protein ABFS82_14G222900 [Erythranthe guttata]
MEREEGEDDIVCLESFFINDNYKLTRFTFGSEVLELYCLQSASTDFDLTGQLVWPGAELMNMYLSKNSDMLRGCSVIELGSGVGITGIFCSRFCSKVVLTDHNDEVLKILARNIELHDSTQNSMCASAEKLEWGNHEQLKDILQRHPEGFDLVIGADIYILICTVHLLFIYVLKRSNIPLLFDTVEKLLSISSEKKRRFLLAYVSRTKVMDNMVISEANRHGLKISEVAGTRGTIRNLQGLVYEITL